MDFRLTQQKFPKMNRVNKMKSSQVLLGTSEIEDTKEQTVQPTNPFQQPNLCYRTSIYYRQNNRLVQTHPNKRVALDDKSKTCYPFSHEEVSQVCL